MRKEELVKETIDLKEKNLKLQNNIKDLEEKIFNLEQIRDININIQVELERTKRECQRLNSDNILLRDKVETYEEVFQILKDKNEPR